MIAESSLVEKVRENWLLASEKLYFKIITPFCLTPKSDYLMPVFGFLPNYGSANGIVIDLILPPYFVTNKEVKLWARQNDCNFSYINAELYLNYDEDVFIETLNDWKVTL